MTLEKTIYRMISIFLILPVLFFSCGGSNNEEINDSDLKEITDRKPDPSEAIENSNGVKVFSKSQSNKEKKVEIAAPDEDNKIAEDKVEKKKVIIADPILPENIFVLKRLPNGTVLKEKVSSESVVVKINQIINKEFPKIQLLVSVTDRRTGQPVEIVDTNVFFLEENDALVKRENIESIIQKKQSKFEIPLRTVLAIDKSGSMAYDENGYVEDIEQRPMAFAKKASLDFIKNIKTIDDVKVIAFDQDLHDLGKNVSAVPEIQKLEASGDTALYGVLYKSVRSLTHVEGIKTVILLTDGKNDLRHTFNNSLKRISLKQGLALANKYTIPVFTIGFGKNADKKTLMKIAEDTHSLYFGTEKKEDFSYLYESIKHIINNQYIITYKTTSMTPRSVIKVMVFSDADKRSYINSADLISKAVQLEQRLKALEERERELAAIKEELAKQLDEYKTKNALLKKLHKERRDEYNRRIAEIKKKEDYIKQKLEELKKTEEILTKNRIEMARLEKEIKKLNEELDAKKKEVDSAIADLEKKKEYYLAQDKKIEFETKRLKKKEKILIAKAKQLSKSQRSISVREITLEQEKLNLADETTRLTELKSSLRNERAEIKAQLAALTNIRRAIAMKEKKFQKQLEMLEKMKKELEESKEVFENEKTEFNKEKEKVFKLKQIIEREKSKVKEFKHLLGEFVDETSKNLDDIKEKDVIKTPEIPNENNSTNNKGE